MAGNYLKVTKLKTTEERWHAGGQRRLFPPVLSSCEISLGVSLTVLVPPTQGGHGTAGASPEEDHGVGKRTGALPYGDRL